MADTDLKPCPFCGSAASATDRKQEYGDAIIECVNYTCSAYITANTLEAGIRHWNTRALSPPSLRTEEEG